MIYPTLWGLAALSVLTIAPAQSFADERCKQLDILRVKYAGVELTPDQKVLKVKLTAWYLANCGRHEAADVKSATFLNSER
jgi:hypothetical protein